ncbi:MAG TPA: CvpA family protein [Bryobacteraceae bacterium]|nr:CvpA family protein [Bryobacteraceae bacterium]
MNWIDLVLISVLGLSVLTGLAAGFARVGVGFIAALVGIFVGFWSYGVAGAYVLDYVSSRQMANLIGFCAIFFGFVILGAIVGRILAKFLKWAGLSWFDRLLGGAFGMVRGFVICAAMATVLLAFAPSPPPRSVVDSKLLPYITDVAGVLAAMTPHDIKDSFRDAQEKVQKAWSERHPAREAGGLRRE